MYLNHFSESTEPLDMTQLEEFESLKESARDLGISYGDQQRYLSRNLVFRNQRFHFLEWGDPSKPALVLLHGTNQSAHSWDLVSLHLSSRYHVFALDQRGHGDSEWSRGAHYTVTDMMEDVKAFLQQLGVTQPIVIGHSMGGMVTLTLAHDVPELLKAVVVVDIGPEVNERGSRMIREFVGRNIEFDDLEEFLDRVDGDVARAGDRRRLPFQAFAQPLQHVLGEVNDAVPGGLLAHPASTEREPLPGEHPRHPVRQTLVGTEQVADLTRTDTDITGGYVGIVANVAR